MTVNWMSDITSGCGEHLSPIYDILYPKQLIENKDYH